MVRLEILTKSEIEQIHEQGINVLEKVGVRVDHEEVYRRLLEAGAKEGASVDYKVLKIPRDLVEKSLTTCPKGFNISDCAGNQTFLEPGVNSTYFSSPGTYYLDENGVHGSMTQDRVIDWIRLADGLENVDATVLPYLADVPSGTRDFKCFALAAKYTNKHLRPLLSAGRYSGPAILEMADVILNGKSFREMPFFQMGNACLSPGHWAAASLEGWLNTAGHGIPLTIASEPMIGATSPVTIAGSLIEVHADILSGIVINQVLEPGRPCIYVCGFGHVMDMRTTMPSSAAPEAALLHCAGAQVGHSLGIPSGSWVVSDSKVTDGQSSMDSMFLYMAHSLAGFNCIWGPGSLETQKAISPVKLVIDDEIIGCVKRFRQGVEVNDEKLAVDLIMEVGLKGDYLTTDHTAKHFREELRQTRLSNTERRAIWITHGSKSIEQTAAEFVKSKLAEEPKVYLDEHRLKEIGKIDHAWTEKAKDKL